MNGPPPKCGSLGSLGNSGSGRDNYRSLAALGMTKALAALLCAVTLTACASTGGRTLPSSVPESADSNTPPAVTNPGAALQPYIEADVHFMSAMIEHHAQAI